MTQVSDDRPLRSDAERNRRRILDVARELFAERGLETSFDEIARRAGVGVGTVYRRFPLRDDLIDALFEERLDAIVEKARQALEDHDPWEGLRWFLENSIAEQAADRGFREVVAGGARGSGRLDTIRGRLDPALDALIQHAAAEGGLRPGVGGADLGVLASLLSRCATDVQPELWRRYLTIVLDGLRRGPGEALPERVPGEDELRQVMHGRSEPRQRG